MAKARINIDTSSIAQAIEQALKREDEGLVKDGTIGVGFKRLNEDAVLPVKAHPTDSGFDLVASEDVIIAPGETKVVPTGIAVQLPEGYEAQVRPRSGVTSKTKLRVNLGTIDQTYRGEIGVIVDNIAINTATIYSTVDDSSLNEILTIDGSKESSKFFNVSNAYIIRKGDRIAQLVVQALPSVQSHEIYDMTDTDRGTNGFGSTGTSTGMKTNGKGND